MHKIRNVFIVVLMLVTLAFANTQGPNSAATITGAGWTNPTNAATTNAVYATESILPQACSGVLTFSSYGFSVPAGATINGITVAIVGHASFAGKIDMGPTSACGGGVQLTKTVGVAVGSLTTDATSWPTTDATFTEGSGASLWGTTWSTTEINASGFGVLVTIENNDTTTNRTASVDSVLVTVTYTPAATGCKSCFMPFLTGRKRTQTQILTAQGI